jgi:DNA mismatch repair protein MSH4
MHLHYPSLVLVPDTFISPHSSSDSKASLLIDCIEGEFEDVPIEPVKRKYWNETVGGSSGPSDNGHPSLT